MKDLGQCWVKGCARQAATIQAWVVHRHGIRNTRGKNMNVSNAVQLAIRHKCWDGQDPHTAVEECMWNEPCDMHVHIAHRGIVLTMSLIVEPQMSEVVMNALDGLRPCYIFTRAMLVSEPAQVDAFLNELRISGLEFSLM